MKNIIDKIKNFLVRAWGNLFYFLIDKGEVAIQITNTVKDIINNPLIDYAVAFTPTVWDDKVLAKAKEIAPKIATQVGLAMGILRSAENEKDAFPLVMKYVSGLPIEGKAIFLREFSGELGLALADDGKISSGEMISLIQLLYKGLIKK